MKETDTKKRISHPAQLCWNCRNAIPSPQYGCPWSREFKPVKGWTAKPIIVKNPPPYTSYCITGCPLYIPDKKVPQKTPQKVKRPKKRISSIKKYVFIGSVKYQHKIIEKEWTAVVSATNKPNALNILKGQYKKSQEIPENEAIILVGILQKVQMN